MQKVTMFGKLLSNVRAVRFTAKQKAQDELWKRNGLDNPAKRNGYRMAETQSINRDGTEVVEYRLYKLIDASVVTISSTVTHKIENGLQNVEDQA